MNWVNTGGFPLRASTLVYSPPFVDAGPFLTCVCLLDQELRVQHTRKENSELQAWFAKLSMVLKTDRFN